jgi:RNA polymerase sigma-70 factor (ECF subfamily)
MSPDRLSDAPDHGTFEMHALACLGDVRRYAQSLARNQPDTDDLVQETFTRALRYWQTFSTSKSCQRWLFAICRNSHYRRRAREQLETRVLEGAGVSAPHEVGWWSSCSRATDEDAFEVTEHLAHALDHIPLIYRRVFELVDLDDHTYDVTAAELAVPIGTVRSRLSRARHRLRDALRAHHGDEE